MHLSSVDPTRDVELAKWSALPLEEKKRQFRELMRSPYWRLLPESVQTRIRLLTQSLFSPGDHGEVASSPERLDA